MIEKKLKKTIQNSNFVKHILENYHNIDLDINKDLEIINLTK